MAMATSNETGKVNSAINVTPMVDVMLVLLIIFMVITPLLQPGPSVQLARTISPLRMPDADKDDALLVAINKDGRVFLGYQEVSPAELAERIRDRSAGQANKPVFVKADARCRYGAVVGVVDNVRSAGVSELGLLTEQKSGRP